MVEFVLVDADMLAGWRRATPSLTQLYQAVLHLERQHPQADVTVIADPSLKWALSPADQALFEADIVARVLTCAPAGTKGGLHGFIAAVAARMGRDRETVVVTDRAIAGLRLARVSVNDGRWQFNLDGGTLDAATAQRAALERAGAGGRRRPAPSSRRNRPGPASGRDEQPGARNPRREAPADDGNCRDGPNSAADTSHDRAGGNSNDHEAAEYGSGGSRDSGRPGSADDSEAGTARRR